MCEAFAEQGISVQLVHPQHAEDSVTQPNENWWTFYGVTPKFRLVTLPSLLGQRVRHRWLPPGLGTASMLASFGGYFTQQLVSRQIGPSDIIYSRNIYAVREILLLFKTFNVRQRPKIGVELHRVDEANQQWVRAVVHQVDLVVTITNELRKDIATLHWISSNNIRVEPDGVDLRLFGPPNACQSDELYKPPPGFRAVVVYAGHLYKGRGVETLIECARLMRDVFFLIVGGYPKDLARLREQMTEDDVNVKLLGFVPPAQVGRYLSIANILVAPYTKQDHLIRYRSPLKLFEYMGACKPIIITDHQIFREVLTDGVNALLIEDENPVALQGAILHLLNNPGLAKELAERAFQKVQQYTWENRARRILSYMAEG